MIFDPIRYNAAIARVDAENAQDPHRVEHGGQFHPKELLYARQMTHWLDRLYPDASEPLRLAARCQHIRRWDVPRESYPMDRPGYLAWRKRMYDYHADIAERILREVGYRDETVARVRSLLRKERLKADPEAQALEDVICVVFLENYFAEFAQDRDEDKLVNILRRTWAKMSPRGHEAALGLDLSPEARELVTKALEPRE